MLKAKSNIRHNGTDYLAGELLPEMDEKQAQALVSAGVAELVNAPVFNPEKAAKKEAAEKAPKKTIKSEKPSDEWTKQRLLGYARSLGLTADDTLNKKEILELIKNAPETPATNANPDEELASTPAVTVNPNYVAPEPPADAPEGDDTQE
jgi:hypothetical protein